MEMMKPLLDEGRGGWVVFVFVMNQENRAGETHIDYSHAPYLLLKVPVP